MRRDPHVVALCGSLRDNSKTRTALQATLDAAADSGASTELVDLRAYDLPPIDADDRDAGDAELLRETVAAADAVVLGTPNYHGSYAAPLKNALDYCGRDEFEETTVGLLEVAGGSYPRPALIHLRTVCRTLNAWTLPTEVGIPDSKATIRGGDIVDPNIAERVRDLGEELVRYAGVERFPDLAEPRTESAIGD